MLFTVCNVLVSVPSVGDIDTEPLQENEDTQDVQAEIMETIGVSESEIAYQEQMLGYAEVTTESIVRIYGLLFFILTFLIFVFFYRLIKYVTKNM